MTEPTPKLPFGLLCRLLAPRHYQVEHAFAVSETEIVVEFPRREVVVLTRAAERYPDHADAWEGSDGQVRLVTRKGGVLVQPLDPEALTRQVYVLLRDDAAAELAAA